MAAPSADKILTTAEQVHSLSVEEAAQGLPVRVRGVVTFVSHPQGLLFIQDETGGVFVEISAEMDYGFALQRGQLVEVLGVSVPGGFAPNIQPEQIRLVGMPGLPPPRPVTFDQMATGREDCNLVEFRGIIRAVRREPVTWSGVDMVGGGGRVMVGIAHPDLDQCERLVDAEVSVRGVCVAAFNAQGQLILVALRASGMDDISVLKPAPADPFTAPLRKSRNILRYALREEHGHRVRVRGVVTFQQPGRALFVLDQVDGLYAQTRETTRLQVGDLVDIVGFPAASDYVSPVLEDAIFRKVGSGPPPVPIKIGAEFAHLDTNHAALVQLEGVLLNQVARQRERILQLRSGDVIFEARLEGMAGPQGRLDAMPEGSRIAVTGICLVPAHVQGQLPPPERFSILLRSPADVTLLERPSWWTARHTFQVLVATLVVFVVVLVWVAALRSRVKAQTRTIHQKAQREAALEERTRIARNLHDELGGTLTRIALLSDPLEGATPGELRENMRKISQTAREATQALDEIVWAVNPEHDNVPGVVEYLAQSAEAFLEDTPIRSRVKLPARLPTYAIPTEVRHELFLVFREALHNALKHAAASELEIEFLAEARQLQVKVRDNGLGFDPAAPGRGGTGIKNMHQRLQAIGGAVSITSQSGLGTTVTITIPMKREWVEGDGGVS